MVQGQGRSGWGSAGIRESHIQTVRPAVIVAHGESDRIHAGDKAGHPKHRSGEMMCGGAGEYDGAVQAHHHVVIGQHPRVQREFGSGRELGLIRNRTEVAAVSAAIRLIGLRRDPLGTGKLRRPGGAFFHDPRGGAIGHALVAGQGFRDDLEILVVERPTSSGSRRDLGG